MESSDGFIGSVFKTPAGHTLLVVDKKVEGRKVKYEVICSLCSKDKELFPEKFFITKGHLKQDRIPCGCSSSVKWSKTQWDVRIKRECVRRGYNYLGYVGVWQGTKTKLILYSDRTKNTWKSTDVNNFMNNKKGDPIQGKLSCAENLTLSDEHHIQSFHASGKLPLDTVFYRSKKEPYKWSYTCLLCSRDKYTLSGNCSGIFTSTAVLLRKGVLPCRCSKSYRRTFLIADYEVKEVLKEEDCQFIAWVGGYKNTKSKFRWRCTKDHLCITSFDKFIYGNRCSVCAEGNYGYYFGKEDQPDALYLLVSDLSYFKVGRSFKLKDRLKENQRSLNKFYGKDVHTFVQKEVYHADHKTIYSLEQVLVGYHKGMYDKNRPIDTYGSNELIKNEYYHEVTSFCKDYIEEWWK